MARSRLGMRSALEHNDCVATAYGRWLLIIMLRTYTPNGYESMCAAHWTYKSVYAGLVAFARLRLLSIVVEQVPQALRKRWNRFRKLCRIRHSH